MIKFVFKWVFRLFLLAVMLVVVAVLSIDPILRVVIQNRIRAETGMDAQIGKVSLGLVSPTFTIRDFRLYNPPDFGGTPFLNIPEIHIEYDRVAAARKEIHLTLIRFNLGELDIVKNEAGRTNIFALGVAVPTKKSGGGKVTVNIKQQTGYDFKGIDALNVSVGKVKFIDLSSQQNNREQTIGIENCVIKNVKSPTDLGGLGFLIALRGGDFFTSLSGHKSSGADILKLLGL
jgi:uncharacterized protein involved in outer membrane biogenesis